MPSPPEGNPTVCAVIVTFNPGEIFAEVAEAAIGQVSRVIFVDNGSDGPTRDALRDIERKHAPRVSVIANDANLGLAAALNIGVRTALDQGFEYVLTLDHDSVAAPGMVAGLLETYRDVAGANPGIVAPQHVDRETGRKYRYVSFGKYLFRRVAPEGHPVACSFSMTSGSLVRREVFEKAGLFREDYFVYAVDNEFCRRVLQHGYGIFVSDRAVLFHREGSGGTGGIARFPFHAPRWSASSLYYIFRNLTFDLRANPLASSRLYDRLFLLKTFCGVLLAGPDRGGRIAAALRGISDGRRRRMGKAEEA